MAVVVSVGVAATDLDQAELLTLGYTTNAVLNNFRGCINHGT
jgi:hypothetical protein